MLQKSINNYQMDHTDYETVDPNITDSNEKDYEIVIDETGKKRRRKRRKLRVRKHSPEYYQQLKKAKLNKKRETQWNSRFVLDSLPVRTDAMSRNRSTKKAITRNHHRLASPKDGAKVYKTFNAGENKNKSGQSKSFNIRVMSKKQDTNNLVKLQAKKQANEESVSQKNSLQKILQEAYEEVKFNENHYQILKDIIKNSKAKTLSSYINAEIARLKNKESTSSKVEIAISNRSQCIKELSQLNDQTNEKDKKEKIEAYQLATLKVLEDILKWKEDTEKVFKQQTQIRTKLTYKKDGKNYTVSMSDEVKFMCKEGWDDVFLLSLMTEQIQNELLVKIRACETLILQEMLEDQE